MRLLPDTVNRGSQDGDRIGNPACGDDLRRPIADAGWRVRPHLKPVHVNPAFRDGANLQLGVPKGTAGLARRKLDTTKLPDTTQSPTDEWSKSASHPLRDALHKAYNNDIVIYRQAPGTMSLNVGRAEGNLLKVRNASTFVEIRHLQKISSLGRVVDAAKPIGRLSCGASRRDAPHLCRVVCSGSNRSGLDTRTPPG